MQCQVCKYKDDKSELKFEKIVVNETPMSEIRFGGVNYDNSTTLYACPFCGTVKIKL